MQDTTSISDKFDTPTDNPACNLTIEIPDTVNVANFNELYYVPPAPKYHRNIPRFFYNTIASPEKAAIMAMCSPKKQLSPC